MLRWSYRFIILVALVASGIGCGPAEDADESAETRDDHISTAEHLVLARAVRTDYRIVIAADSPEPVVYAAEELSRFLGEISGATFEIVDDTTPATEYEIHLGLSSRTAIPGIESLIEPLGAEGYVILANKSFLGLVGGSPRGTLYSVYGLLEDHLGCRWFTPEVSVIPKQETLTLPPIQETVVPDLEYRESFVFDCYDGDWAARNRMNSSAARLEAKHGGKVRFGAGMFVHTFNRLVPPEEYFDEHPEYFALVNGERLGVRTQLCTTNEEVVQLCIQSVKDAIAADPEAFVYSVSQNDWHNYCECEDCTKLAEDEGSWMAPVLYLVNRVAEAIEEEYPDKAIETLAYQYTRTPPKTMRPRDNVIIRLCSIECCFMHSFVDCDSPENKEFVADARAWKDVSERLWVWDYVTSFGHYLTPFPNLRLRNDNIQFFIENNVVGIFEQDAYQCANGEFSALSGYLNAKFLWNKDYDEDTAINEFLDGVYGEAAAPIRAWIDLLHDKVRDDNIHANIWIGPTSSDFLTDDIMERGKVLWNEAESLVQNDPDTLRRVKFARLSYDYAWLETTRNRSDALYTVDHASFTATPKPEFAARIGEFFKTARAAEFRLLGEGRLTLDEYEATYQGVTTEPKTFAPIVSVILNNPQPGLSYSIYSSGNVEWEDIPDFESLTPDEHGIAEAISAEITDRPVNFGARLRGYFHAEQDGVYTFCVGSNDGSVLRIAGHTVDNGGLHATMERCIQLGLKAGYHPIEIDYFQAGASKELYLKTTGPELTYGDAPMTTLFHDGGI